MKAIFAKLPIDEVPRSCAECRFGKKYGAVGEVKCCILNEYFTGNAEPPHRERPDECPITSDTSENGTENIVTVRWFDGYLEEFETTEVRFGGDLLWMRLADGKNRHIPLRQVRWFGMSKESHQREGVE